MNKRGYENRKKMDKKVRQYRSRQGRSDNSYSESAKVIGYAALILFSLMLGFSLYELIW